MLFLYVFGNNLNEKLGHIGYLAFYLTGGILAGCGQVLASNSPTLGASGAISAVAGLFLVLLPRTNIRIFVWIFVYVDVWEIPSLYFILFSVVKDFLEPLFWGSGRTAPRGALVGEYRGFRHRSGSSAHQAGAARPLRFARQHGPVAAAQAI